MRVGVQVLGVEQVAAALNSMDREIRRKAMRAALYEGAKVYASAVKRNAPVDSGTLMMSIKPKATTVDWDNPHAGVTIDTKRGGAWYWHFVEFGTRAYSSGERRYSTGAAGGVVGRYKGKTHRAHAATPARSYIRRAADDWYTRNQWREQSRALLARRVAAWQRSQSRARPAGSGRGAA